MDLSTLAGPPAPPTANDRCPICEYWTCRCPTVRRLVAAGIIRSTGTHTVRVSITPAGVTGSIRPLAGAR